MGWISDAKSWVQSVLRHETSAAIGNSVYETAVYSFAQVGALPKVARSLLFNPSANKVGKHLLHIIIHDLTPWVLVNFTNNLVQQHGRAHLDNNPDSDFLSTDTLLQAGLYSLNAAAWIYGFRKRTEFIVHMAIVTIETPPMVNTIKASTATICDQRCSPILGSVRDLAAYFATDIAISGIGYAPFVGEHVAALLRILHNGRYIAFTGALPRLCNDHQITYLTTHPELAWSLGLTHAAAATLISYLIKNSTGIATVFYAHAIDPLMLIALMMVAAHMDMPAAPRVSTRTSIDPVAMYQYFVGLGVDATLLGLKKQIPRILQGRKPGNVSDVIRRLPWEAIDRTRMQVQHNPIMRLVLPTVLHDLEFFVNDHLIHSNWAVVQVALLHAITLIESLKTNYAIRISSSAPGVSSSLVQAATGMPKFVTKLLLQLLTDEQVHKFVRACRIRIEMLGKAADDRLVASFAVIDTIDSTPAEDPFIDQASAAGIRRQSPHLLTLPPAVVIAGKEPTRTATMDAPSSSNRYVFFAGYRKPPTVAPTSTAEATTAEPPEAPGWLLVDAPPTGGGASLKQ